MSSTLAAPLGAQLPRLSSYPESTSSAGREAVDLAQAAGLGLDPWQAFVLEHSLAERADGSWAAFEVGLVVSRQNGKGAILEARELAGLFLLGERLIIHSAHQFDTSLEAFRRLLFLIEENPDFRGRVKRVSKSHGEEGIELMSGQRVRFRTRTKGGGRGFSGDCLILDEAMELASAAHGALLPTLSARPNPQVWYTGSAVDQDVHEHGVVFSRIRERGIRAGDEGLAFFEWSAEGDLDDPAAAEDREGWASANPGLGFRISEEHVEREQRSMDPRTFAVERLGIGDWPRTDGGAEWVIDPAAFKRLTDPTSRPTDPLVFAVDTTPDRSASTIAAAGLREDGRAHVEVIERRRGTGWVAGRLKDLVERHAPDRVVLDGRGPVGALLPNLEHLPVEVLTVSAQEYAQACGAFFDRVEQEALRHLGTAELASAVRGAGRRSLGDAWAWSRKSSAVDIAPLVACTLALWGAEQPSPQPFLEVF